MSADTPRAVMTVTVTEEEYRAAARVASRNGGQLRTAWVGFALCAGCVLTVSGGLAAYPLAALLLLLGGGVIALTALCLMRYAFFRTVAQQYRVFCALFPSVQVTLWEDTLEYRSEACCRRAPYALFSRMVESRTALLLLQEDNRFLVIPKRAIPDEQTLEFLRRTFARKYRKVR